MGPEFVNLKRDCEATQIPSGNKIALPKDLLVRITQSLGGNYTVVTDDGYMAQIAGTDADALGKTPVQAQTKDAAGKNLPLEQMVWNQLKTCYDPEIPINIVELGLIYDLKITPEDTGDNRVDIKMTLTAPGCGMGDVLKKDAETKILHLPGVKQCNVELVWEPVWDQSKMSEAAKLQLGL